VARTLTTSVITFGAVDQPSLMLRPSEADLRWSRSRSGGRQGKAADTEL